MQRIPALTLALALAGCEGTIFGPEPLTAPSTVGPAAIECTGEVVVGAEPMLRLTRVQYETSVRELLVGFVGATRGNQVATDAFAQASLLPDDETPLDPHNRFRKLYTRYDRDLDQLHVDGYLQVASWVSGALVPTDRDSLLGACANATAAANIEACVRSFISRFGARALRHPLSTEELDRYLAIYGDPTVFDDAGLHDVIGVMLQAPDFVYRIESGADAVQADVYALDDYELAARLSYAVWDGPPDDALYAAAARGELRTSQGRRDQLTRMFDDPRARDAINRFADDWLRLSDVPDFSARVGQPAYDTFVGADRPSTSLSMAARQELRTMVTQLAFAPQGRVSELLTTRAVFPATPELAKFYGLTQAWNGTSAAPLAVDAARPGLFTRVGLLGTGLVKTRPIVKGAFLFDQFLCAELGTPPAGAASQTVTLAAPYSTRQYLEALTEQPATSCQGCHHNRLNALGFATEGFDGLGRSRTAERFIDDTGAVLGETPIDDHSQFQDVALAGPDGLAAQLGKDARFEACVARQLFRYEFAREETSADLCTLEPMWQAARTGSLRDVLLVLADSPAFTQRRITP